MRCNKQTLGERVVKDIKRKTRINHLADGYSNTVPQAVIVFGSNCESAIAEKFQYIRFYVVTFQGGGPVHSELNRYNP